jgi:transcriptional regulator with XRE-family HTH domain
MLMITPEQVRAARSLLDLHQSDLASKAGLGLSTIVDFERERRIVSDDAVDAIQSALERAGIEFIAQTKDRGFGVRLAKPKMR